jgi:hypothetical protein
MKNKRDHVLHLQVWFLKCLKIIYLHSLKQETNEAYPDDVYKNLNLNWVDPCRYLLALMRLETRIRNGFVYGGN